MSGNLQEFNTLPAALPDTFSMTGEGVLHQPALVTIRVSSKNYKDFYTDQLLYQVYVQKLNHRLHLQSSTTLGTIGIFSSNGQLIHSTFSSDNSFSVSTSDFQPGTYIILIQIGEQLFSRKVSIYNK